MKKNFKCLVAATMATMLVFGSMMTTFADTDVSGSATASGEASGSAVNTGTVDTNVFHVTLPTAASDQFDFIADPGDYIRDTGFKALSGTGISVDTSNTNKVYFPVTSGAGASATKIWAASSAALTVTNKSSIPVKVALSVTANIDGMELVTGVAALKSKTDPQLYLGIETALSPNAVSSGSTTAKTAITSGGASVNGVVTGSAVNYEVVCSGQGAGAKATYSYEKKSTLVRPWVGYNFYLTGKCNDVTCDDQTMGSVDITWTVTPSVTSGSSKFTSATPAMQATEYDGSGELTIAYSLGTGSNAAEELTDVVFLYNGTRYSKNGTWNSNTNQASNITINDDTIVIGQVLAEYMGAADNGTEYTFYLIFDEDTENYKTGTVTISK